MKFLFKPLLGTLVAALVTLAVTVPAHAQILTSGGTSYDTGTPTPTLSFSKPITLTITTSGTLAFLALDEWVTSDGTITLVNPAPSGQTFSYQLNGAAGSVALNFLVDNYTSTAGALTPNDGYLYFGNIAVTAGQTLTINAQSLTFGSAANFNPNVPTSFSGNVFGFDNNANALTNSVSAAPEPGTWAMLGLGGAGLLGLKLRRRAHGA